MTSSSRSLLAEGAYGSRWLLAARLGQALPERRLRGQPVEDPRLLVERLAGERLGERSLSAASDGDTIDGLTLLRHR